MAMGLAVERKANRRLVVATIPPSKVLVSEGHPQAPGREPRFTALSCEVGLDCALEGSFKERWFCLGG